MEGFADSNPHIKKLNFPKGKIEIFLKDGRIIIAPVNKFPSIKKLTSAQRKKWAILDGIGFDFQDSDELFHLYQFTGKVEMPCC